MLVLFAEILLGFLVEGFLAPERAEIIGLCFILGCASGGRGINVHAADGIMHCGCHELSFQLDYAQFYISDKRKEAYEEIGKMAYHVYRFIPRSFGKFRIVLRSSSGVVFTS